MDARLGGHVCINVDYQRRRAGAVLLAAAAGSAHTAIWSQPRQGACARLAPTGQASFVLEYINVPYLSMHVWVDACKRGLPLLTTR